MRQLLSLAAALSAWVGVDVEVPNPPAQVPPGLEGPSGMVLGWLKWGAIIAGVAGLMIAGIMIALGALNRRSSLAADGAAHVPKVIAGLVVVSVAAGIVGALLPN